jgi:hypothetical protein
VTGILYPFRMMSGGVETEGADKIIEVVDDSLIEAVELGSVLMVESGISWDGTEKACRKRGIDSFKELQEDEAD